MFLLRAFVTATSSFSATNGKATQSHFVLGDLRKFTEQYGDIIQLDQPNRAYMTQGVSGIDKALQASAT